MADLICPIALWAGSKPDQPAVWQSHQPTSFRELNLLVSRAESALRKRGIGQGDRIALRLPASLEFIATFTALNRIGAIALLLSQREPYSAVEAQLTALTCRTLVYDESWDLPGGSIEKIDVATILGIADSGSSSSRSIPSDTAVAAVFTSGSVEKPKAALLSYGNLYYNALGSNENISFGPDDRWLVGLPLYHVGGLGVLFRSFIAGGSVVLPEPGFDLLRQVAMNQITHISVVNKQLFDLVDQDGESSGTRTLKAVLVGGSAVSTTLINQALSAGFPIHTSYGLTEMASQVTTTSATDRPDRVTSSGRPLAYRQIKVADGEILVRGECLFQGYLTGTGVERTIGINEWFGTRDLGSIDPEGYLTVVGRKDNMFLSGGENIQPEEIEEALMNIGRIYDAVVVPMTDEEYGERPVAFVQVHPDTELDEEAIQRSLREILPGFKVPSRILPFPSTETKAGIKFSRKELRAFAVQLLGKRS